jgi:Protein of unknown function (DUF3501)
VKTELTLNDIVDLRAYERIRESFRTEVMATKRKRRIPLGPIMTIVFECEQTVRFQIQEMARVEKIISDQGIQAELDVYNRLLPTPGELSCTLFIELTTEADLRHWLPQLVGIESSLALELHRDDPALGTPLQVVSVPEATHDAALTRESVTPAVHYLRFPFAPEALAAWTEPGTVVTLVSHHPAYEARTVLEEPTRIELEHDLF